jgi:hypothetical protein
MSGQGKEQAERSPGPESGQEKVAALAKKIHEIIYNERAGEIFANGWLHFLQ